MSTTALVTGANQGLGRALVAGIARRLGKSGEVYLTGRDPVRVDAAARELGVHPHRLDVTSTADVDELAELLRERHGSIDVVISNAAARITPDRPQAEQVAAFVDTNNLGTTRMIRAFAPLLAPGGRFLVVASAFGSLRNLPPQLHDRFDDGTLSLDDLDAHMLAYADAVESDHAADEGWPDWINVPSKVGQVAAMRILARERQDDRFVAAVCPGLVDTAASRPWFDDMSQAQSPEEAAGDILGLALDPVDPALYGELVQHRAVVPWR